MRRAPSCCERKPNQLQEICRLSPDKLALNLQLHLLLPLADIANRVKLHVLAGNLSRDPGIVIISYLSACGARGRPLSEIVLEKGQCHKQLTGQSHKQLTYPNLHPALADSSYLTNLTSNWDTKSPCSRNDLKLGDTKSLQHKLCWTNQHQLPYPGSTSTQTQLD